MDEEDAAEEIEGGDEEQVVLAIGAFAEKTFEARDESDGDCSSSLNQYFQSQDIFARS